MCLVKKGLFVNIGLGFIFIVDSVAVCSWLCVGLVNMVEIMDDLIRFGVSSGNFMSWSSLTNFH